jgi:8-oxo-dGTP diphosphatase
MTRKSLPHSTQNNAPAIHPMPLVRVDVVCLSVTDGALRVLLAQRAEEPFQWCWGLPGGVLRIDLDASLEAAAHRVGQERMNLALGQVEQVLTVGGADRDPRAPWAMTVVYRCLVGENFDPATGKRVDAFKWFTLNDLDMSSAKGLIAFDHHDLINRAVAALRTDVAGMRFSGTWFPEAFTVPELQHFCETVLGEALDKVTFRRRLEANEVLRALPGQLRTGPYRPAQLYVVND